MYIKDIEAMTEKEIQAIAVDRVDIKGHDVYFVDVDEPFGYSCIVFYHGNAFKYLNDFSLHHPDKTIPELRELYIRKLKAKVFTLDEITGEIKDYKDYVAKREYIQNHYSMQHGHTSIFGIYRTDADHEEFRKKVEKMYPCARAFAYFDDQWFAWHLDGLFDILEKRLEEKQDDFDYWESAFVYEMFNHEYAINWQADFDTLSAFGCLTYVSADSVGYGVALQNYFEQLNFTEAQRTAYFVARREYWKQQEEAC